MKILLENKPERASDKVPDVSDLLKGLFYTHMQNLLKAIHSPQHNTSLELQSLAMEPSCIPKPQVGTRAILQWILCGITILKLIQSEMRKTNLFQHNTTFRKNSAIYSAARIGVILKQVTAKEVCKLFSSLQLQHPQQPPMISSDFSWCTNNWEETVTQVWTKTSKSHTFSWWSHISRILAKCN